MAIFDGPIAVVETATFLASANRLGMTEQQSEALVVHLASFPESGDVIVGTGGVRKLRWALPGRGKSGGARVIYYFHNDSIPLYALDIYAKNKKENLTASEKDMAKKVVEAIVANPRRQK